MQKHFRKNIQHDVLRRLAACRASSSFRFGFADALRRDLLEGRFRQHDICCGEPRQVNFMR